MVGLRATGVDKIDADVRVRRPVWEVIADANPRYVVYSAGVTALDWIGDASYMDFKRLMDINVYGFINVLQGLIDLGTGYQRSIVAITSDAAWRPMRASLNYCASKAALEMAVKVAARELAPHGWKVNAVAPGKVSDTQMTEYVDKRVMELRGWTAEEAEHRELSSNTLGRMVHPVEVAEVVVSTLLGPQAQTGAVIPVNGGR
jgi:NAD(P)-dependent dehydrogenase (short-subunit alcohol dehydrogenase family)